MTPFALITGATGGLGRAFAAQLAERGYGLVLTGRNTTELEEMATGIRTRHGNAVCVVVADLSEEGGAERIAAEAGDVDLLVNNAGFGLYGEFTRTDLSVERGMIRVNAESTTALTKLLLPGMLLRKRGRILNVASTAAFQPGPLMAVYYATKSYILSLSHALAVELRGTGVTVTCLCPGPTRTGFDDAAQMGSSALFRGRLMDADTVARIGIRACLRGKAEIVPGWRNKCLAFGTRLVPRALAARIARYAQRGV